MNNFKLLAMLCIVMGFSSCRTSTKDHTNKTGKEYTSAYICPMHCEGSGAEVPGLCPVCGMDYIKNDKK
ncbi:MAG: hypothetical protein JJ975_11720 [Bacteroidia bacterium]|nr:hypothetical protein [Bacteroidia bacterium]